jgi:hypothetical protein
MARPAKVIEGVRFENIPFDRLFAGEEPVVLKGLVKDWPIVKAAGKSPKAVMDYLASFYNDKPTITYIGEASIKGRFAYNEDLTGFNFSSERCNVLDVFKLIQQNVGNSEHPYYYMNSIMVDESFPGMRQENDLNFNHPDFDKYPHIAKIWIGSESRASCHSDTPRNIACCVQGDRRFTLFPPNQIQNLYPGPLTPTPGGQTVTMTDIQQPDFDKFPRLKEALDNAVIAEMEPGDALYYPSLWWHEVDALDKFNVMINYWWIDAPRYLGDPLDVLMHAMLTLRDRSPSEKKAWREIFDYYIFGDTDKVRDHLPEHTWGALGPMDQDRARRLIMQVRQSLNR